MWVPWSEEEVTTCDPEEGVPYVASRWMQPVTQETMVFLGLRLDCSRAPTLAAYFKGPPKSWIRA